MSEWIYDGVEFKDGDVVKVVCATESYAPSGMGEDIQWDNAWVGGMGESVGKTFTIEQINNRGVRFKKSPYRYPLASIKKLDNGKAAESKDRFTRMKELLERREALINEIEAIEEVLLG